MTAQGTGGRHRVRLDWHGKLAGGLLGFVVGGMTVNQLTDDYGYTGIMIATVLVAILSVASWLRRLSPRAALARHSTRLMLLAALAAVLASLIGPTTWHTTATAVAAGLTITAVLVPTDLRTAVMLLAGAGLVGVGVAFTGLGIAAAPSDSTIGFGGTVIGLGIGFTGLGIAVLSDSNILFGLAFIGLGVAVIGFGIAAVSDSNILFGTVSIGGGVACIVGGVAAIGGGISGLNGGNTLFGVATIGLGVEAIGVGISELSVSSELSGRIALFGVASIGLGLAAIGGAISVLAGGSAIRRVRAWWDTMTADPDQLPSVEATTQRPGVDDKRS